MNRKSVIIFFKLKILLLVRSAKKCVNVYTFVHPVFKEALSRHKQNGLSLKPYNSLNKKIN